MPGSNPVSTALHDLVDDVAYHGMNLVQAAFDLVCVTALGACLFVASLSGPATPPTDPGLARLSDLPRVLPADAPVLCLALSEPAPSRDGGCITALVLDDQIGT